MIKIAHLYHDLMNLYGESGNIKAIKTQLEAQGEDFQILNLTIGDDLNFDDYDFVYIGCGTDANQELVLKELLKYRKQIEHIINKNIPFLATGNAIELFGKHIIDINKQEIEALGTFDIVATRQKTRIVKETVVESKLITMPMIGFQNQSSTIQDSNFDSINIKGFIGTHLLGPVLVRNPKLLEYVVRKIIDRKFHDFKYKPFSLTLETKANLEHFKNYHPNIYNTLVKNKD